AAEQLMPLESDGAVVVNRPSSALNCHRYRLVKRLGDSTVPFPRTLIHASSAPLPPAGELKALCPDHQKVWIKRGDVHAERPEDVVAASLDQVADAVRACARRGVPWVAAQEHVPGPGGQLDGVAQAIAAYITHRVAHRKHS